MGDGGFKNLGISKVTEVGVKMQIAELCGRRIGIGRGGHFAFVDVRLAGIAINVKRAGHAQPLQRMKAATRAFQTASRSAWHESRLAK